VSDVVASGVRAAALCPAGQTPAPQYRRAANGSREQFPPLLWTGLDLSRQRPRRRGPFRRVFPVGSLSDSSLGSPFGRTRSGSTSPLRSATVSVRGAAEEGVTDAGARRAMRVARRAIRCSATAPPVRTERSSPAPPVRLSPMIPPTPIMSTPPSAASARSNDTTRRSCGAEARAWGRPISSKRHTGWVRSRPAADHRRRTRTKAMMRSGTTITAVMRTGHMRTASLIVLAVSQFERRPAQASTPLPPWAGSAGAGRWISRRRPASRPGHQPWTCRGCPRRRAGA
jgi:hypothetical protein